MEQPEIESQLETNEQPWKNTSVWKRGAAMLLYGFVGGLGRLLVCLIAIFQFFSLLLIAKPNQRLQDFAGSLNVYLYQINQFLTVNSEFYPYPMGEWPTVADAESLASVEVVAE